MATVAAKPNGPLVAIAVLERTMDRPRWMQTIRYPNLKQKQQGVVMQRALILSSLYLLVMTTLVSAYMFAL